MSNKKYDLGEKLVDFAANVIFYCKELPKDMTGNYYGNQLLRSSGGFALRKEQEKVSRSNSRFEL